MDFGGAARWTPRALIGCVALRAAADAPGDVENASVPMTKKGRCAPLVADVVWLAMFLLVVVPLFGLGAFGGFVLYAIFGNCVVITFPFWLFLLFAGGFIFYSSIFDLIMA
jgi:hypothetical protein